MRMIKGTNGSYYKVVPQLTENLNDSDMETNKDVSMCWDVLGMDEHWNLAKKHGHWIGMIMFSRPSTIEKASRNCKMPARADEMGTQQP